MRTGIAVIITAVLTAAIIAGAFLTFYKYIPIQKTKTIYITSTIETTQTKTETAYVTETYTTYTVTTTILSQTSTPLMQCLEVSWPNQTPIYVDNGRYIMQINMWNLKSADGIAAMRYCNGTFYYDQNLTNIVEQNPNSWVAGYPEVWFGYKPWASMGTRGAPLPATVAGVMGSNLRISISYNISVEPSLPMDFAFDIWVTKSPNETSVGPGEQEIMIWFYYQNMFPAGSQVGQVTIPVILNGKPTNMTFLVSRQPSMPWEYIAFFASTPLKSASIEFRLADFIKAAAQYTSIANYSEMWVDDVELGSEFGSPFTTSAALSWSLQLSFSS
jgi:hypothetical protein